MFSKRGTDQFADSVQHKVDDLFANGVVAAGIIICSIFLPCDELLGMEQLSVRSSAHLVCHITTDSNQLSNSDSLIFIY